MSALFSTSPGCSYDCLLVLGSCWRLLSCLRFMCSSIPSYFRKSSTQSPVLVAEVMSAMVNLIVLQVFDASHALLQEADVNLAQLMKEMGFYVTKRHMSAPVTKRTKSSFGSASPIEKPTMGELDYYSEGYAVHDPLPVPNAPHSLSCSTQAYTLCSTGLCIAVIFCAQCWSGSTNTPPLSVRL